MRGTSFCLLAGLWGLMSSAGWVGAQSSEIAAASRPAAAPSGAFVVLGEQADLRPAFGIRDWKERGEFVVERLQSVADRSQSGLRNTLAARGVEFTRFWIFNAVYVEPLDPVLEAELASRSDVAAIHRAEGVERVEDTMGPGEVFTGAVEWNIDRVGAPQVWSTYGVTGQGIVVANIDDGVHLAHPSVAAQYRGNLGGGNFDHDYNWHDPDDLCGNPSTQPCDVGPGHGTATMGFMLGDDGAGNQVGVAPGAQWIAAATDFSDASLLAAAQWFLAPTRLDGSDANPDLRPHVINNSWGGPGNDPWYRASVQAWVAAGIFPAFAAGNSGPGCGTHLSPGDYLESYSAGAFDINDDLGAFSARGNSATGEVKPNIAAPGKDVRGPVVPSGAWDPDGDGYAVDTAGGTSWAAPHVAGAVALLWSGRPELIGDVATTRALLDDGAIDTTDLTCGGTPSDNYAWGEGRLDVLAAYESMLLVFADGFESGDLAAWAAQSP